MFRDPACSTFRKILIASTFGVGVFLIPGAVQSATSNSATLQWAANQESDLAGYRAYHGTTSGNYGGPQDIGKTTTYQFVNLASNATHYFSITAYDTSGNESAPSIEVSKAITGPDSLLSISISGGGTVTSNPGGIFCSSGTCSDTFPQGASVTLTAAPSSGSTFSSWGGACTGTGSCVVALSTSSASVSANFVSSPPPSSSLSVNPASLTQLASLTQEEIKRQKKLAKAEKKKQKKLEKYEKWKQKMLAKAEKKVPKKLAKAEKLLAKIQKRLAKIEQKLVRYANRPKHVARLNKKKEKYSMILAKIQEKYSIN